MATVTEQQFQQIIQAEVIVISAPGANYNAGQTLTLRSNLGSISAEILCAEVRQDPGKPKFTVLKIRPYAVYL